MPPRRRLLLIILVLLACPAIAGDDVQFNRDVRPILSDNCYYCHGPDHNKRKAGLRLDRAEEAVAELKSGERAIVPGSLDQSALVARITSTDADEQMPPPDSGKRLTASQVETLKRWVKQGAKYEAHWSLIPPKRPEAPTVKDGERVRNPIDAFVFARLEREGLSPSAEADRPTLIRRLYLDLLGLPPKPAEVDAFVADRSPDAYEKLVDRLLANPHYGERMALEWLDAARFGDTQGYHIDSGRDMTAWRDWVINAYNDNKRFDQFAIEQIAGDLLPDATTEQKIASGFYRNGMINFEGGAIADEYLTAYLIDRVNTTGTVFLGLTVNCTQCHDHKFDPFTQKEFYQLYAFFNAVPENGLDGSKGNAVPLLQLPTPGQKKRQAELTGQVAAAQKKVDAPNAETDARQAAWEKVATTRPAKAAPEDKEIKPPAKTLTAIKALLATAAEKRTPQQVAELRGYYREYVDAKLRARAKELASLKKQLEELNAQIPSTMVMAQMPKPRETHVLIRGEYDKKGEVVQPGTPAALPPMSADLPRNRLGLAKWLMSPTHPLTARVTVNRFWQMYFGTGLVKTAEDFGVQGDYPSHPELLDYLATEFVRSGWDVKAMQRLIVTSATYRQASRATAELAARDPENRLLARGPRFRLAAEFVRDQALAVAGLLDGRIGGKSVNPYQPAGLWEELMSRSDGARFTAQVYVQDHGADLYRRGMYTYWKRTSPPASLTVFDAPDRQVCVVRRSRTNTPLQALALLNDPTYVEAARKLAERVMAEGGKTAEQQIAYAFKAVTAREARPAELAVLKNVLGQERATFAHHPEAAAKVLAVGESPRDDSLDEAEHAAWTMVCSALLNLDETVTKN